MNLYTNHFNCSKNNDTGETIIQFLQVSPHLVNKDDKYMMDGVDVEIVASVVMTADSAKDLARIIKDTVGE